MDQTWLPISVYSFPPPNEFVEFMRPEWARSILMRWAELGPQTNVYGLFWRPWKRPDNVIPLASRRRRLRLVE